MFCTTAVNTSNIHCFVAAHGAHEVDWGVYRRLMQIRYVYAIVEEMSSQRCHYICLSIPPICPPHLLTRATLF